MSELRIVKHEGEHIIAQVYCSDGILWDYAAVDLSNVSRYSEITDFYLGLKHALRSPILRDKDFEVEQ